MESQQFYLNNLWRWKCGLEERQENVNVKLDINELAKSQMSEEFIKLMTNRMVLGTFRYGKWQDNKKNNVKIDRISSIRKRLDIFEETGNSEYLVDIANLAMIEFEISDHPNLHFAAIDDGHHAQFK